MGAMRPHRHDLLIAASGVLGGLLMWIFGLYTHDSHPTGHHNWVTLLPLAVMAGCELMRRTAPTTALAIAAPTAVLDMVAGSLLVTVLMFTDLVYAAVLYGPWRLARAVPVAGVIVTVGVTVTVAAVDRDPDALVSGLVVGLVTVAPAWTGAIVRQHREEAATERLRAEQTALLAELDRREAVAAERARMARELHDMVANHLSAIAIHSTAALRLEDRPGPGRDALGVIRENSVLGLAEMRRLIGLLRATDGAPEPEPAAAPSLNALGGLVRNAGPGVVLRDERPRAAPPLPTPVELAAYRIVQECLTNALKHAAPGEVAVLLAQDHRALTVAVDSPYCGPDRPGPRAPGSGTGLIGMRERTELLGGTFEAGAGPGGRLWRVRAVLPLNGEGDA